jgi:hypothetical protein
LFLSPIRTASTLPIAASVIVKGRGGFGGFLENEELC